MATMHIDRRALLAAGAAAAATAGAVRVDEAPSLKSMLARMKALKVEFDALQAEVPRLEAQHRRVFFELKARGSDETAALHKADDLTGFGVVVDQADDIGQRMCVIQAEMMTACRPTLADLALVAAGLKLYDLDHYWNQPEEARDWDVRQVTCFLDRLISWGTAP